MSYQHWTDLRGQNLGAFLGADPNSYTGSRDELCEIQNMFQISLR